MNDAVTWSQLTWILGVFGGVVFALVGVVARVVVALVVRAETRLAQAIESLNETVSGLKESMLLTRASNSYVKDVEERLTTRVEVLESAAFHHRAGE